MRRNGLLALVMAACSAVLIGCGSGAGGHATTGAGPARRQGNPKLSAPGAGNGEAGKPAGQIVADAAAALRRAHGYVMQGAIVADRQRIRLRIAVASRSDLEVGFSADRASVEIIALPGGSYIRGNRVFWAAHLGSRGVALSGHWVEAEPSSARALTSSLGPFAPATLSRCLTEDHGTLSVAGKTIIGGRPAVIVRDAGNAPGASPGTLAVATSGEPYPLRVTATGRQRAGGLIDVCNDGKAGTAHGSLMFSRFGAVKPISPPANAIHAGPTSSA